MATVEEATATYEELANIERAFDDAEIEIIRTQTTLLTPLYTKRQSLVTKIPNFWPLVLEQAPPDIDQYIQPSDSALLLSSLTSLSVSRFEPTVDPRSVSITLEFKENEHFTNTVLEKKFWYRRDKQGFSGLVSEPVKIDWKSKDKDLTGGLLDLVHTAYAEEQTAKPAPASANGKGKAAKPPLTPTQKALRKKISTTGMGGSSFFAWFGFIGRRVTAEESAAVNAELQAEREGKKATKDAAEDEDEEEDQDDLSYELEIFPDGDDLAVAISEDLWPGALKYFTQAQEADAMSDLDFESGDEDMSDLDGAEGADSDDDEDAAAAPPAKKQKRKS